MTIDEINIKAFELVSLVEIVSIEVSNQKSQLVGSAKEKGFVDWSDKIINDGIEKTLNQADETTTIHIVKNQNRIGFNKENYPSFLSLVTAIKNNDFFKAKSSLSFIEKETLYWLIEIIDTKIAGSNLIDYLKNEVEQKIGEHQFYFPVINLNIENPFKIGNVEFCYFTKKYFDDYFTAKNNEKVTISKEEFETLFHNEYIGQVIVKIKVSAESEHAEEIAKNEAQNAVDVLKIYGITSTVPETKTMFDLNHRLNYQTKANFLSQNLSKSDDLLISIKFNNPTYSINDAYLNNAKANGMETFSHFISLKNDDDFYKLIIQSISIFASSLSNFDLHNRAISLITVLESLLLLDDEEHKMEKFVKARIEKLLSDIFPDKELLKAHITKIYKVRHKMVHKAIRLNIDTKELAFVQIVIINLLLMMMRYNVIEKHTSKVTIINFLNSSNK